MILDQIKNCEIYFGSNRDFRAAFAFIQKAVAEDLPVGTYEIDGEDLFASVQEYNTKKLCDAKFEGHRKYIDIQVIVSGSEVMKVSDGAKMHASREYDEEKDFQPFDDCEGASLLVLQQGEFAVFFPHDIHMPGICLDDLPSPVKKIVVKVKA